MVSDIGVLTILLLCACLALVGGQVYLAFAARRVEAEHGLRVSNTRAAASVVVLVVVALLVISAIYLRFAPLGVAPAETGATAVPPVTVPTAEKERLERELAEAKRQLQEIENKRKELQEQSRSLRRQLGDADSEDDGTAAGDAANSTWLNVGEIATLAVPLCVVIGIAFLLLLGDPRTLLPTFKSQGPKSDRRLEAFAQLESIAANIDQERYGAAWQKAKRLDEKLLDRFDYLDSLYLKSYAAIQIAAVDRPEERERLQIQPRMLLEQAVRNLEVLLEEAPNHHEAAYLLAMAYSLLSEHQKGLDRFKLVEQSLKGASLPFDHNRSVCLLHLAEARLGQGDIDGADAFFNQVASLNVMADQIPSSWIKVRFQNVRRHLKENNFDKATAELEAVKKVNRLTGDQLRQVELVCAAFETLIPVRQSNDQEAARRIGLFLDKYVPAELWQVDDEIADEHFESTFDRQSLPLSGEVYRALLFTLAATKARLLGANRQRPTTDTLRETVKPLLCAFHFQVRHREVLAALGGLRYWFTPGGRPKALEWLRSAVDMGTQSRIARRIVERDRALESERRDTLDWFRAKSSLFLHDPTLKTQTRQALLEELGRFQEFQPLLLDLENSLTREPEEPTLKLLRDRAKYLNDLAVDLARRKRPPDAIKLEAIRREYARLIEVLDQASNQLTDLEKNLLAEVGKTVLA